MGAALCALAVAEPDEAVALPVDEPVEDAVLEEAAEL